MSFGKRLIKPEMRCPGCGGDRIGEDVYQKAGFHAAGCLWYTEWSSGDGNGFLLNENAWKHAETYWRNRWRPKAGDWVSLVSNPTNQPARTCGEGSLVLISADTRGNFRPAWPDEIAAATRGSASVKPGPRCVGCGKPWNVNAPHPRGCKQCPWADAYDQKSGDHQEREAYANRAWQEHWFPIVGEWVKTCDGIQQIVEIETTSKHVVLISTKTLCLSKDGVRPAWSDEIREATRGSIPIKVEAGTRGKDSSQRIGSSEDAGASAADAAPPLTSARPALVLEVGKAYRAQGGWKVLIKNRMSSENGGHPFVGSFQGDRKLWPGGAGPVQICGSAYSVDGVAADHKHPECNLVEAWPIDPAGYTVEEWRIPKVGEFYLAQGDIAGKIHLSCRRAEFYRYICKPKAGEANVLVGHAGEPAVPPVVDKSQEHDEEGGSRHDKKSDADFHEKHAAQHTLVAQQLRQQDCNERRLHRQKLLDGLRGK